MPTETFTISRRPAWAFMGEVTVTIECDPLASQPVKLGLAVRAAVKSRANLYGANLSGASLYGASLYGANLSGANLYGANLSGANLYGANRSEASLDGAILYGASLSGANLSGANLSGANLYGANLSGANLYGANLSGASLSGANLYGANLSGANLYGASLYGANLSGATVHGEPVKRMFASVSRINDPYVFHAFELEAGGVKILAGCRWFKVAEFVAHVADEYPDTEKAAETLSILDFIETRAGALKIALQAPVAEAAA